MEDSKQANPDFKLEDFPEGYRKVCILIGLEPANKLCRAYGGTQLYVPKISSISTKLTYQKIRSEFNGVNLKKLAVKYGYSEVWIRKIINQAAGAGSKTGTITLNDISPAYRGVCKVVGIKAALKLSDTFGGAPLFIPTLRGIESKRKHDAIRREYNGRNKKHLALKYGYTAVWINRILQNKGV